MPSLPNFNIVFISMRNRLKASLFLILLTVCGYTQTISSYMPYYALATLRNQDKPSFALRRFVQNGKVIYLVVDSENLTVSLVPEKKLTLKPDSLKGLLNTYPNCTYSRAWYKAQGNAKPLQDAGISHAIPDKYGIILTIDLCPSEKPLDRSIFIEILHQLSNIEKPVPLAISISGHWLLRHQDDLNWLIKLDRRNKIDVIWVNHSFNHYYNKELPLYLNFMLMKGTNVDQEVLLNEKTMIEHNLVPSIFFRFPGLISGPRVFRKVMDLGLIPIGSDAWLAKGEHAKDGNIVLVHANGNEPLGIKKFIDLLHRNESNIHSGQWKLFDLRESVIKEADF
jgi:hypothetical protein